MARQSNLYSNFMQNKNQVLARGSKETVAIGVGQLCLASFSQVFLSTLCCICRVFLYIFPFVFLKGLFVFLKDIAVFLFYCSSFVFLTGLFVFLSFFTIIAAGLLQQNMLAS